MKQKDSDHFWGLRLLSTFNHKTLGNRVHTPVAPCAPFRSTDGCRRQSFQRGKFAAKCCGQHREERRASAIRGGGGKGGGGLYALHSLTWYGGDQTTPAEKPESITPNKSSLCRLDAGDPDYDEAL